MAAENKNKDKDKTLEEDRYYLNLCLKRNPERALIFLWRLNDAFGQPANPDDLNEYANIYAVLLKVKMAVYIPVIPVTTYLGNKSPLKFVTKYKLLTGALTGIVISEILASYLSTNIKARAKVIEEKYANLVL